MNTPMHKEPLGQAQYTAPRTFGYGAQMKRLEKHDSQFQQQMAPFQTATTGKAQNRHPSDVVNRSHWLPLDKEETSSHHVILTEEQQSDSTTRPDLRPKEIAATASTSMTAGVEHTMHELMVPSALQTFFWWVSVMMRYVPESTQIKDLNAAKSTICEMSSEVMAKTTVSPGFLAGFAQPVMTTPIQPSEDRDVQVVQFMDEMEGGGEPQATAVQQSHKKTPQQAEELPRSRSWDSDSRAWQEGLDRVRKDIIRLKSVVKKADPPAPPAVSLGTWEPSPRKKDWEKRSKKECFATHNKEKVRSIAAANKEYAKLMEERWQAAARSLALRSLFSDTSENTVQMKEEPSSPVQSTPIQASAAEEKHEDAAGDQSAEDDDNLDKGILDEGRQMTPIDDLASPEDSYFLGFEYTDEQTDKMVLSLPRLLEKEFTFVKPAADVKPPPWPATPAVVEPLMQPAKVKPNYQLMPKGTCLIEPPLTQPNVWVHYKINKLPVPKWRAELSQLRTAAVKEFQAWCLCASNWKQEYGNWAAIPIIGPLQPEWYGLQGLSRPLAKLALVLGLDEIDMSLLQVVIQAQILAEAGDKLLGRGKIAGAGSGQSAP